MKFKIILISIIIPTICFIHHDTQAVSASVKAANDYKFTIDILRKLRTIVENFPTEEKTKSYEKIKAQFQAAGEDFYGQDFTSSVLKFKALKSDLIVFMELIAKDYLERTKSILDSTSKESFDIIIDFSKDSSFAKYFHKPFDPLNGVQPYTDKYTHLDYHFFRDRETIERYIKSGYQNYHYSKRLYEDPEIVILKNKKKITSQNMDYIIARYMDVVLFCRQAKQYGIEIHKIRKINELGDIIRKYNLTQEQLTPIFDDRIPKEFKVDAIDNLSLLYTVEQRRLSEHK